MLLLPGSSQPPVRFQPQNTILSSHAPQKAWLLSFSYCGGICRQSPISAHTPLVGRDNAEHDALFDVLISTHTPLAGRDYGKRCVFTGALISTHTPLAGRDKTGKRKFIGLPISTHTPLAGRDMGRVQASIEFNISTHTPLAGRDLFLAMWRTQQNNFNSHAPCGARPQIN